MARLNLVDPSQAEGKVKELQAAVKAKMGRIPNLLQVISNSPAALEGYLGLSGALDHGTLGPKLAQRLALTVGEADGCEYCVSAHTAMARHFKLSPDEIQAARRGGSSDPKADAALKFALAVVDRRGRVSDEDVASVKEAGFTDGQVVEIVAQIALSLLTNYLNNVTETPVDWPAVEPLVSA